MVLLSGILVVMVDDSDSKLVVEKVVRLWQAVVDIRQCELVVPD